MVNNILHSPIAIIFCDLYINLIIPKSVKKLQVNFIYNMSITNVTNLRFKVGQLFPALRLKNTCVPAQRNNEKLCHKEWYSFRHVVTSQL